MTDSQMRRYWLELAWFIQTGEKSEFLGSVLSHMNNQILEQTATICARARKHFGNSMFTGIDLENFAKQIMSPTRATSKAQTRRTYNYERSREHDRRMQEIQRNFEWQRNEMDRFNAENQRIMNEQLQRMQEQTMQIHHQIHTNNMFNGF